MDELFERPKKDTKPRRGRPPGRKNNKTLAKEAEMRAKQEQVVKSRVAKDEDEDDLMLCDLEDELWHHSSSSVDWEKLKQYDELYSKLCGEHFIPDFEYMDDANARNIVDRYLGYIAWNNHGNEPHWMENPEYLFQPFTDAESILDMMEEQGDMEYYDDTPEVKDVIDMLRGLKKGKKDRAVIWNPQTGESKTFDMSKPKDAEEVARLTEEEGWEYESYPESDSDFNKARGNEMKASKGKVKKESAEVLDLYSDMMDLYYLVTSITSLVPYRDKVKDKLISMGYSDDASRFGSIFEDYSNAKYTLVKFLSDYEVPDIEKCGAKDKDTKKSSVSFKSHTGTFKPIAKAGHYTMWQSVEHGDKAYNIITQTKKNRKTGQLVEKIIAEDVDGFEDPEVQKMFGVKKIDRSGGIRLG